MKRIAAVSSAVLVLAAGAYLLERRLSHTSTTVAAENHLDAGYVVAGIPVKLQGGVAETGTAPGSAAGVVTRYFGNELRKDLDGDGTQDIAFILTQQTGGSGTFYYVVAALTKGGGLVGSHGVLLGDRIAPQNLASGPGRTLVANFAERAPGEPFSVPPSVGTSLRLMLDPATLQFGEVIVDFEGEADPARMSLGMKTWIWIRTSYADGREIAPAEPGDFTLTFSPDGTFSATTDCNSLMGAYTVANGAFSLGPVAATRMYCEDSQEAEFVTVLENAATYRFTSRGELILGLEAERGQVVFR